jgi:nucleotide-binding universal stress UspA family protein
MAKRILVPLDMSATAEAVVPVVADLARGSGAAVRLLHVAPLPENQVDHRGRVVAYTSQEMARLEAEALDYLRSIEIMLGDLPVESIVRFGAPRSP